MDIVTKERLGKAGGMLLIFLTAYVAILAIAKLREYPYIGSNYPAGNVITVEGQGEAFAIPDIAEIGFSVHSEKKTLPEAEKDAAERMNKVIAYLKDQGIDEKDIKTTNYSANPHYDYSDQPVMMESGASGVGMVQPTSYPRPWPGNQVVTGYDVDESVSVKIRDIDIAGEIIAGVTNLGVTNVYGPNYTIDDEDELKHEAREKAIEDARAKARQLADDLDVRLVRVVSFSENGGGYYPMYAKTMMAQADSGSAPVAPDLPPGENTVSAYVTITYEIR